MALPRIDLTSAATREAVDRQMIDMKTVVESATMQLVRKGTANMGEVILRESLTSSGIAAGAIRCAFGYNVIGNDGCNEIANFVCETCRAVCCALHQAHDRHKDMVNDTIITKQQQVIVQCKIRLRAPDVAEPKVTEDSDASKKKKPRVFPEKPSRSQATKTSTTSKETGAAVPNDETFKQQMNK